MTPKKYPVATTLAPQAIGPYSQGIWMPPFLFCSGQIALDPKTMKLVGDDVVAQAHQVMKNIDALLRAHQFTFENIVKTTIFLVDMGDFKQVNDVYASYLNPPYPARSTVAVAALPMNGKVEIEVVAG